MTEKIECTFCLFRYVPNIVRGEFVNIGVVMYEAANWQRGAADWSRVQVFAKFTRDWRRVKQLDSKADLRMLTALANDLEARLTDNDEKIGPDGILLTSLRESLSTSIQITDPRGYLAASLPIGIEEIYKLYVS